MLPLAIWLALGVDAILVALHLANAVPIPPLEARTRLLDLGIEANVPTWWASAQLWTAAVLLASIGWRTAAHSGSLALAALLAIFSLDEVARLHEPLAAATRSEFVPITGLWPLLLGPLAIAVVSVSAWMARTTWSRDPVAAAWLGAGLAGFLVSVVGIELLVNVVPWGGAAHFTQVLAEETGELIAGTFILAGAYRFAIPPSRAAVDDTSQPPMDEPWPMHSQPR